MYLLHKLKKTARFRRFLSICLLLAVTMLALLFPWLSPAAKAEERELTILVYICGTDLESSGRFSGALASADLKEMCRATANGAVTGNRQQVRNGRAQHRVRRAKFRTSDR